LNGHKKKEIEVDKTLKVLVISTLGIPMKEKLEVARSQSCDLILVGVNGGHFARVFCLTDLGVQVMEKSGCDMHEDKEDGLKYLLVPRDLSYLKDWLGSLTQSEIIDYFEITPR
jgi:hypothetical protein